MKKSQKISLIIAVAAIIILVIIGIAIGIYTKKEPEPKDEEQITKEKSETATADQTVETATEDEKIEEEKRQTITNIAKKYLPAGYEFEHQVLKGDFGAWQNAILFFYKEKDCFRCHWRGKVLIPQRNGYKQINLPDFNQFNNETVDNIKIASVMFTNLDRDEENEIIILNEGYKKGPDGWPLFNTAVIDWRYYKFGAMSEWENYFNEHCENAECLKKYIQAYENFFGMFSVENEYIAADLNITRDQYGNLLGQWDAGYGEGHMCIVEFDIEVGDSDWVRFYSNGDEKGNIAYLGDNKIEMTFDTDLSELDCGYGHPDVLTLDRK